MSSAVSSLENAAACGDVAGITELLADAALELAPGTVVVLLGLKARPELNGRRATVVRFSAPKQRYVLDVLPTPEGAAAAAAAAAVAAAAAAAVAAATAAAATAAVLRSPPQMMSCQVPVPPGHSPGDIFAAQLPDGRILKVEVPADHCGYTTVTFPTTAPSDFSLDGPHAICAATDADGGANGASLSASRSADAARGTARMLLKRANLRVIDAAELSEEREAAAAAAAEAEAREVRLAVRDRKAAARAEKEASEESKRRAARRAKLLSRSGASALAAKEEFAGGLAQVAEMGEDDRAMGEIVLKQMVEPQMLAQCAAAPDLFVGAEQQVNEKLDAGELTDPNVLGMLRACGKANAARVQAGGSSARPGGKKRGKGSKKGGMAQALATAGDRFRAERLLRPYYLSTTPASALEGREGELDDALAELRMLSEGSREALTRLCSTDKAHEDTYACLTPFYGQATSAMSTEMTAGLGALQQISENPDLFVKPLLRTMFTTMLKKWCPDIDKRVTMLEAKLAEVEALAQAAALKKERARAKKARQKLKKKQANKEMEEAAKVNQNVNT